MNAETQQRPEPPFLGPLRPVRPPNTFLEEEDAEADAADQTEPVEADEEEEVEEALVAKLLRSPTAPTAAERAAHAPTHLPYRSWCDECVAGRRDNPAHRHVEHQENSVHEVMMDYCFLRRQDEEEVITILVLKERQSRAIQAWVVPNKSTLLDEGAAAERAVEGIRRFGFRNKLILKVDNENAILALRTLVLDKLGMSALEEEPHPHESQSNGAVENGVRLTKGLLRVHLLALERKLGHRVPSKHPILAWLVEHVADTATKYLKGADGRTAYERLFGKHVHEEGLEFGEQVLWRQRASKDMNVLLEARWTVGLWLSRAWGTPHHRIGDSESVWQTRAVQRRPETERWHPDLLGAVRATPWRNPALPLGEEPAAVLPPLPAEERAPAHSPDEARRAVKSVYIRNTDLEKYGYTASCSKCQKMRLGRPTRGMAHTSACRARIELAMAEDDDPRWNAATDRIAHRLEDSVLPAEDALACLLRPPRQHQPPQCTLKKHCSTPSSPRTSPAQASTGCPSMSPKERGWTFTIRRSSRIGQSVQTRTTWRNCWPWTSVQQSDAKPTRSSNSF